MKILFLHGWNSVPGGVKPTYLKDHGHEVINPKLPNDDFAEAVRIAQNGFDQHQPQVVVGSSRGGAVAMNIDSGEAKIVLLCPAWKKWGTARRVRPDAVILHSRADDVVPFADSEELATTSEAMLIEVGTDHRLADPESLAAILSAFAGTAERVYLDHNVFVDVYQNRRPNLRELIDCRKAAGDIFPYSPAHMEEIAVVFRCQSDQMKAMQMVEEQVALVGELSDTWEILPSFQRIGPSRIVQEHPFYCMMRVTEHYDQTLASEEGERFQLSWKSPNAFNQVQEEFGTELRAGPGVELFPETR